MQNEREIERENKEGGGREERDVAHERGEEWECCANMKHERRKDFNGWVVLFSSFKEFVDFIKKCFIL